MKQKSILIKICYPSFISFRGRMVKSVEILYNFCPCMGSIPGRDKLFCVFLQHINFFYLITILAYSQSYILYYISFLKYLELTKKKNQGGHPSQFQAQNYKKSTNLGLKKVTKISFSYLLPRAPQPKYEKLWPHYNYLLQKKFPWFRQVPERQNIIKCTDILL